MKKKSLSLHTGIGLACFVVGAWQIYRGLEVLDYLPIIIIGICVIVGGSGEAETTE